MPLSDCAGAYLILVAGYACLAAFRGLSMVAGKGFRMILRMNREKEKPTFRFFSGDLPVGVGFSSDWLLQELD